jgi:valyl-tRNA synthetase
VTKAHLHEKKIPWKDITVSGFVTLGGQKMSKSKGNVISPQEVMEKYGSDALRFWASSSKLGEDLDYQEKDIITGKKFVTKILNATNFVFTNLKHQEKTPEILETDRLFLSQLNKLISSATKAFDEYNYSKAKLETDKFFWQVFADNYLEIIKNRVYNGSEKERSSAFYTLYQSLLTILKMFAPITPFITEEIYQNHFKKYEKTSSIHISNWPKPIKIKNKKEDDKTWSLLLETITKVRQEKSKAQKSMKSEITLCLPKKDQESLSPIIEDLKAVTNTKQIKTSDFKVEF